PKSETPNLDKYSRDLTALAKQGKLDPVIGRAQEIETVIEILARRKKNNPVLIGEPGVGKTAIVEGLAQRMLAGEVPEDLRDKRLVELNVNSLVAGTQYRGQFEERVKQLLDEVSARQENLILFIDELHTIVAAAGLSDRYIRGRYMPDKAIDVIDQSAARVRLRGTSRPAEIMEADAALQQARRERDFARTRKNHERTKELETRFDEAQKDLDRKLQSWERTRRSSTAEVVVEDVAEIISRLTGVPVTELTQEERQRLLQMEQRLHQRVIGQDEAVKA